MTRFLLVRHGVTDWIEEEKLHGISDIPLSVYGKKQAKLTAQTFSEINVDRMYSSSLSRAMQTAEEIGKVASIQAEPLDGLMEMNYGWMEGTRDYWPVIKGKPILITLNTLSRLISGALAGESFSKFNRRVLESWKKIVAENPSGTIVVVAHSGVLRAILANEFGGNPVYDKKYVLTTCSISEIVGKKSGQMKLVEVSRNSHLPKDIMI
jgi:broad specificity phosphatase PhoE